MSEVHTTDPNTTNKWLQAKAMTKRNHRWYPYDNMCIYFDWNHAKNAKCLDTM